ncbi:dentin sialophosphoprotein [Drosophila serrata]|uniref:dentin sialophosphoprotein n=1 Tax=Drosophila serrata TaxID=7274 RepID=UPI000A1CF7E3|nr:dentin sialophosphoprotein [Drosophila serrata]
MWRMRMRLLFGFVVLLALDHLERSVLAQKYYMNFAFNNNNPDGNASDESKANPPKHGQDTDKNINDGINENSEFTDKDKGDGNGEAGKGLGDSNGNAGGDVDGEGDEAGYQGEDGHDANGNGNDPAQQPTGGKDDDNDDSDSKDNKNRRHQLAEQEDKALKRTDHSHHSSYEISIDDSFGGRYVRSIYESSESHGHSGSRDGSNPRDSRARESSQAGKDQGHQDDQQNTKDAGAPAVGVEVADATEAAGIARAGNNEDYEEM